MAASAKTEAEALDATRRLGLQLLQSRSHVNNAPLLITILSSSHLSGSPPSVAASSSKCLLEALTSLQAFFLPLLRSGEISPASRIQTKMDMDMTGVQKASETNQQLTPKDEGLQKKLLSEEAQAIYTRWLREKYMEFGDSLLKMLSCEQLFPKVRIAALHAFMELVRTEGPTGFSNHLYSRLCSCVLGSGGLSSDILGVWESEYLKYVDVSYYTYSNVQNLVNRRQSDEKDQPASSDDNNDTSNVSTQTFVHNAFDVLSRLPPPSEDASKNGLWSTPESDTGNSLNVKKDPASTDKSVSKQVAGIWKGIKKQRFKFSKAWLAFLQLKLPLEIYKKVLAQLPRTVIPFLTNPIYLSDFLTSSYNIGGLISVMALNGLFILITNYGLEYPDFYTKLYALLEPSIFVARHRARFFELLDTCLKSSHLPAYLAAAFAKKLGRLGLTASPSGCLVVIAMIHNLLRRHPSINCLVDGQECVADDDSLALEGKEAVPDLLESNGAAQGPQPGISRGADPFMPLEPDPTKCNALKSSLWEIEALRRHYCPAVSRFVASLETDLTVRAKTTEVSIEDFSSGSYATIFSEEVGRRLKQVPLAFYQTTPTSIFPSNNTSEDFLGWTFSSDVAAQQNPQLEEAKADRLELTTTRDISGSHESHGEQDHRPSKKKRK